MKNFHFLIALFAIFGGALFAQEEQIDAPAPLRFEPPVAVFSAGFSGGALVTGEQLTLLQQSLYPKPDSYGYVSFLGAIRLFPIENLGIEFSASPGITSVDSTATTNLNVYNSTVFKFGLDGRFFLVKKPKFALSFDVAGGGTYSLVQYNDSFKSLILSGSPAGAFLYDLKNSFGYYAKAGIEAYMFRFLYAGIFLEYFYQGTTINNAAKTNFDAGYINVPIEIGVYLF